MKYIVTSFALFIACNTYNMEIAFYPRKPKKPKNEFETITAKQLTTYYDSYAASKIVEESRKYKGVLSQEQIEHIASCTSIKRLPKELKPTIHEFFPPYALHTHIESSEEIDLASPFFSRQKWGQKPTLCLKIGNEKYDTKYPLKKHIAQKLSHKKCKNPENSGFVTSITSKQEVQIVSPSGWILYFNPGAKRIETVDLESNSGMLLVTSKKPTGNWGYFLYKPVPLSASTEKVLKATYPAIAKKK